MGGVDAVHEVEHRAQVSVEAGKDADQDRLSFVADLCKDELVPVMQGKIDSRDSEIDGLDRQVGRLTKELAVVRGERDMNAQSWSEAAALLAEAKRERPTDRFDEFDEDEEIHGTTHVLDRAAELVCGPKAEEYGDPVRAFTGLAKAWQAYHDASDHKLDARDVSQLMIIYKAFRDRNLRKIDTPVDQAGYSQLCGWIGDPRG